MESSHVGVITSGDVETQEVLQGEEGLVQELVDIAIILDKTFCLHLRTTNTNEIISIVAFLLQISHKICGLQIVGRRTSYDEYGLFAAKTEIFSADVS